LGSATEEDPYFVSIKQEWRSKYETMCEENEKNRQYCRRIRPIWADCEGTDSPVNLPSCCKGESGLRYLWQQQQQQHRYDWYVYVEPHVYVNQGYMRGYVSSLDPDEVVSLTTGVSRPMGYSDFDGSPYKCSVPSGDFLYPFGHPLLLSRGALEVISAVGLVQGGGLVQQCKEFGDTAMDVGMQILLWMYSVPSLFVKFVFESPETKNDHDWMIRIFVEDMYKTHQAIMKDDNNNNNNSKKQQQYDYKWHRVDGGFNQTELFREEGDPRTWTEWHLFQTKHCWIGPPPPPPPPDDETAASNKNS